MKQKLIVWAKRLSKDNPFLRRCMRFAGNLLGAAEYAYNTRGIKAEKNTVVFSAFYGQNYCCTPKAVYEYMQSNEAYENYQYIWLMKKPEDYPELAARPNTTVIVSSGRAYHQAMARAGYWIFNHRMADYIRPKKDQVYVQCWHGTPLKRLGYDIESSGNAMNSIPEIRQKYRVDAARFHYLLSPSPFATERFITAWDLKRTGQTDKILEVGYPRNDFLLRFSSADAKQVRKKLGIPTDRNVLLYAPTWRDDKHDPNIGYTYENPIDFDALRQQLGQDWVILFRAHYIVANAFDFSKYKEFVYDVSGCDDINELYIVSDLLVTDYSSVFFDYANLKRPILFYMYDKAFYADELRGFYLDLAELPGPIVETQEALTEKILTVQEWFRLDEKYRSFCRKYNPMDDGAAAKRLVERVFHAE